MPSIKKRSKRAAPRHGKEGANANANANTNTRRDGRRDAITQHPLLTSLDSFRKSSPK